MLLTPVVHAVPEVSGSLWHNSLASPSSVLVGSGCSSSVKSTSSPLYKPSSP
jgi:hypothetical protein